MRLLWAENVAAENRGKFIEIIGVTPAAGSKYEPSKRKVVEVPTRVASGLLSRFARYNATGDVSDMPHRQFANADNREKLLKFVRDFGPVVADFAERYIDIAPLSDKHIEAIFRREPDPEDRGGSAEWVTARQNWDVLESERDLFVCLLKLLAAVKSGDSGTLRGSLPLFGRVITSTRAWIDQYVSQSEVRKSEGYSAIDWSWTENQQEVLERLLGSVQSAVENIKTLRDLKQLVEYAQSAEQKAELNKRLITASTLKLTHGDPIANLNGAICEILNAFPTYVQYLGIHPKSLTGPRAVEFPRSDLTFGIRPVLYFMLRTEYLRGWELRLCGNPKCEHDRWFRPTRKLPNHCSPLCARRDRQNGYWERAGSEKRRVRKKKTISKGPLQAAGKANGKKRG